MPESTGRSEKRCPLAVAALLSNQVALLNTPEGKEQSVCRRGECAWWIAGPRRPAGECAIAEIANSLWDLDTKA